MDGHDNGLMYLLAINVNVNVFFSLMFRFLFHTHWLVQETKKQVLGPILEEHHGCGISLCFPLSLSS